MKYQPFYILSIDENIIPIHSLLAKTTNKEFHKDYNLVQNMYSDLWPINHVYRNWGNVEPTVVPLHEWYIYDPKLPLIDFIKPNFNLERGLIINNKVKSIFKCYNIDQHIYYPFNFSYKNKRIEGEYFHLHLIDDATRYIDFSKTTFILVKSTGYYRENLGDIKFDDYQSFINFYINQGSTIRQKAFPKNIIFLKEFDLDLFSLFRLTHDSIYCSGRLKKKLEEQSSPLIYKPIDMDQFSIRSLKYDFVIKKS